METENEESSTTEKIPTAEELIPAPDSIGERKKSIKNFFTKWIKDDYDKLFLIVLIAAFIIRIIVFTKTQDQALWWDAADYLASAKRWAGFNPHLIDMWYYRRGFLWPLISTIFFKVGLGEIGIRFLVVLLSTGIVFITYLLVTEMFNKKLALLTSIGVTFSWIFLFFTGRPLTNLPATFFFLTALLFFWKGYVNNKGKKYFYLFGIFYALAILIRMQYLMFGLSFLALAIVKEKLAFFKNKGLWIAIMMFIIILTPQIILHNMHFGNPLLDLTNYYLGVEGVSKTGEVGVELAKTSDLFVYINNLPYILDANQQGYSTLFIISPLFILFVIGFFLFFIDLFLGFDKIFKNKLIQKKFFIFFWIISTFLFLGYIAPHLEQRYIMPIVPFLFFLVVYPLTLITPYLKKFNLKNTTIILILSIILILLLISNIKFGFSLIESKENSYSEIKQAGLWVKQNSNPEDIIIGGSLPQLTYYSERSTYPFDLAYRRDLPNLNETDLDKFILENRPKYFILSIYEYQEPWVFAYPEKHKDILTPVQGYGLQNQPILVIYKFNYDKITSL